MFRVYLNGFRAKVRAARANVSDGQYKKLVASILKKSNKVSAAEKKAIIDDVAKCVKGLGLGGVRIRSDSIDGGQGEAHGVEEG